MSARLSPGGTAVTAAMLRWFEDHAAQGLFTTDANLVVTSWNRWLTVATGLSAEQAIGRPLFDVMPSLAERGLDVYYREAIAGMAKMLSHTLHRHLLPCPRPDGELMPQSARIAPLLEGDTVVGTVTLIDDVSERVSSERQLRSQIAAAEAARKQAEDASRAKDEFLATLSHEIRTPLSAVIGWVHLLKARDPDAATIKRAIDVIERNAKSQLTLITDMLDMARLSTGKMRIEMRDVNMVSVVSGAVDAVRPAADAKQIRLVVDLPPGSLSVSGDPDRLLQVVWNIMSNAVKFTGEGGMVVVSLRGDRTGTHLTVADTGQGIDPKFIPQVFERFKQADTSAARYVGGLGLGLALVKEMVAMHGGTVEAASPGLGLGSTFSVHLPNAVVGLNQAPAGAAAPNTDLKLTGISVLVVEDDEDAREIAVRSISEAGGEAVAVANASDALGTLASGTTKVDILICDLGLPGTDGYALLSAIRGLPGDRGSVPAIAVTAYATEGDAKRARQAGFLAHVSKPYLPGDLVAAVRDARDSRQR